jgi:hypothetical protein
VFPERLFIKIERKKRKRKKKEKERKKEKPGNLLTLSRYLPQW